MVFGILTAYGLSDLVFIDGNMNADQYLVIVSNAILETCSKYRINDFIFQQDGAPCHTAKKVKEWFADNYIILSDHPAQSPDLNPIEHVWCEIKRQLGSQRFISVAELNNQILEIWNNFPLESCVTLIESMENRVKAILAANGKHTKY